MKSPGSLLKWSILMAATAIAVIACWLILLPFLDVIAWALVLVISFYPLHRRIECKIGRPSLSALLSCLLVVLTILIPVLIVTTLVINEVAGLKDSLESRFNQGFTPNAMVRAAVDWASRVLNLDVTKFDDWIREHADQFAQAAARYSLKLAGNVSGLLVSFCFTVFAMFFLFRDGEKMVRKIPDLLPLEESESEGLLRRIRDVIDGSIYGVLAIGLIQGTLGGLAFWFLGIPSSVLWGVVMSVASLVPLFGSASVWVPGAIYLLLTGDWQKAIILVAFGVLVISSVDNFLRPKLVGDKVKLSELVIFFSVLGGLQVFGVLGVVVGPVVFAIAGSLLHTFTHLKPTRGESEQTYDFRLNATP